MEAVIHCVDGRVQDAVVEIGAVDEEPDQSDGCGRDRHRDEDGRLHDPLVAHAHREHGEAETEAEREGDVEDHPAQVVDQRSRGRPLAQVEEGWIVGEQLLEVANPEVVREVEAEVAVVEREPDRVIRRIDEEEP